MNDEPGERYDHNANNVTGSYPIDWENDLVPIQIWKEQAQDIKRLLAAKEQAADDHNWRAIVTEALTHSVDEISNGRARDIIHELRVALLPFSARHATMRKYYDSDSGHVPESVIVPRLWLAEAYRVLKEGLAND